MFFEYYTENLWGRHPREIDASWGAQRVKGLSISAVLRDMWGSMFGVKNRAVETSLIEQFKYPKFGPGQLWEVTAWEIEKMGGQIIRNATVIKLHKSAENRLEGLTYRKDGKEIQLVGDYVISSMPLKDLVQGINDVPANMSQIAQGVPYRDYITMGVLVPKIALENRTKLKTIERIPKAYPAYCDTYSRIGELISYLNGIKNLYCVGRNGQHRYNNMDHSMLTAFRAADCILTGSADKSAIWNVNTEQSYHEHKCQETAYCPKR